jgi:membrane protease YdiL (CAAX protease family)
MKRLFLVLSIFSAFSFVTVLACQLSSAAACSPLNEYATYAGSAAIHLGLLSLAMFFLWKEDLRSTLAPLGFPGSLKSVAIYTVLCLIAIFIALFALGVISLAFGFNDQQKVSEKITGLPIFILVFAALGAPITEELFFRGFLTSRFGIVVSSVVFGLMHFAYGSTIEVIGAFLIGLILAATFKLSKSIAPCILAHMAYNALAIVVMRLFT